MNDLISRQVAIRLAEQGQIQGFEWQFKKLCDLPSAEPERKKGKWIVEGRNPNYHLRCDRCRKVAIWTNGISYKHPNFCPNCGADMRGDSDE